MISFCDLSKNWLSYFNLYLQIGILFLKHSQNYKIIKLIKLRPSHKRSSLEESGVLKDQEAWRREKGQQVTHHVHPLQANSVPRDGFSNPSVRAEWGRKPIRSEEAGLTGGNRVGHKEGTRHNTKFLYNSQGRKKQSFKKPSVQERGLVSAPIYSWDNTNYPCSLENKTDVMILALREDVVGEIYSSHSWE